MFVISRTAGYLHTSLRETLFAFKTVLQCCLFKTPFSHENSSHLPPHTAAVPAARREYVSVHITRLLRKEVNCYHLYMN